MFTLQLWQEVGLVNGTIGTIKKIIFKEDDGTLSLPIVVFVEFDKYKYNKPVVPLQQNG